MTRLRAGVHVVPRDDEHVQVGLDPPERVLAPRLPEVLALLDTLSGGEPRGVPPSSAAAAVLRDLEAAGLLEPPAPPRSRSGSVALVDLGLGLGGLRSLLEQAGVPVAPDDAGHGDPPASIVVVAARGPVRRAVLDPLVGEGAPHLVLAGTGRPGSLRLGPLVEPGVTACQRCVDATESEHDPRRTLVIEQLAALPAAPVDAAVVALGLAWAARDVTAYLRRRTPSTWSAVIDLEGPVPVVREVLRHPYCGCAWDVLPY